MKNLIFVIICYFLSSCSSFDNYFNGDIKIYESFLIEDELSTKDTLPLPESLIGIAYISLIDTMLIIVKYKQETYLSICNLNNFQISEKICLKGRGPNEYLSFQTFEQYNKDSKKICLYTYDSNLSAKLLNVTASWQQNATVIEETMDLKRIDNSVFCQGIFFLNSDNLFVKYKTSYRDLRDFIFYPAEYALFNAREEKQIIDFFGKKIASNANMPILPDHLYSGITRIKPDGNNAVDGIGNMDYINFIDLRNKYAFGLKYKNSLSYEEIKNISIEEMMKRQKSAYNDIYVTNDYVFGLYLGNNPFTDAADMLNNICVRIFDWKGTPLASLKFDRDISSIAFDERKNLLYALDRTEEKIFIYDLSKFIEKIRHAV